MLSQDAAAVGHDVGILLSVPAAMAAVSVPVAALTGDTFAVPVLLTTAVLCAVVGLALAIPLRYAHARHRWPAIEVVGLAWLSTALVCAAVLAALAATGGREADAVYLDPWNALFEGMSGITSTGLSMADGAESELSPIIQWWRTLSQWIGGVGVVLFTAGFAGMSSGTRRLYEAEARGDDLADDLPHTIRWTWILYLGLSVAAVLALVTVGEDWWVALNHGLAGISTGGFTITDDSFVGAGAAVRWVAVVTMVAGATTFVAHHDVFVRGHLGAAWRLTPVRIQLVVLTGGVALLLAVRWATGAEVSAGQLVFEWVSASATAGFTAVEDVTAWGTAAWSAAVVPILVVAMVMGAPSGTTGGGVKLDRVAWLTKDAVRRARRRLTTADDPWLTWDERPVDAEHRRTAVGHAAVMLGLWLLTLMIGTGVVVQLTGAPLHLAVFDVASALSSVGLDAGVVSADLDGASKAVFTLLMYVGRLELFAALTLAAQHEHAD